MPIFTYRGLPVGQEDTTGGTPPSAAPGSGFIVHRIISAIAALVLIFLAGVYCAHDSAMKDWSAPLLSTFQLLLGGLVGLIVGEKTATAS